MLMRQQIRMRGIGVLLGACLVLGAVEPAGAALTLMLRCVPTLETFDVQAVREPIKLIARVNQQGD